MDLQFDPLYQALSYLLCVEEDKNRAKTIPKIHQINFPSETMWAHWKKRPPNEKIHFYYLWLFFNYEDWLGGPQDLHLYLYKTLAESKEILFLFIWQWAKWSSCRKKNFYPWMLTTRWPCSSNYCQRPCNTSSTLEIIRIHHKIQKFRSSLLIDWPTSLVLTK